MKAKSKLCLNAAMILIEPIWEEYCVHNDYDHPMEQTMKKHVRNYLTKHQKVKNWVPPIDYICVNSLHHFLKDKISSYQNIENKEIFDNLHCVIFRWSHLALCISRISKSYYDEFKAHGDPKYEKIHELFLQILYFILEGISVLQCDCKKKHCLNELSALVWKNMPNQYNMINPLYMLSTLAGEQAEIDVGARSKEFDVGARSKELDVGARSKELKSSSGSKPKASKYVGGSLDVLKSAASKRKISYDDHVNKSTKRCKNK
jgi:hypothetical protein